MVFALILSGFNKMEESAIGQACEKETERLTGGPLFLCSVIIL